MSLHIRPAKREDILALCTLMRELTGHETSPDDMVNRLQFVDGSPFDSLYVCEEDGVILGLLGYRIRENLEEVSKFGEVSVIVVDSDVRRKGAGRFMMDYAKTHG